MSPYWVEITKVKHIKGVSPILESLLGDSCNYYKYNGCSA